MQRLQRVEIVLARVRYCSVSPIHILTERLHICFSAISRSQSSYMSIKDAANYIKASLKRGEINLREFGARSKFLAGNPTKHVDIQDAGEKGTFPLCLQTEKDLSQQSRRIRHFSTYLQHPIRTDGGNPS